VRADAVTFFVLMFLVTALIACDSPNKYRKYCKKCRAFKPMRAHHCSICGRCIVKVIMRMRARPEFVVTMLFVSDGSPL
jgi:hypothetical protein